MADYKKAKATAESLLDKYQIDSPIVNVFDIAEQEGAKVLFVQMPPDLKDVSGFVDFDDNQIYVNKEDSTRRQMFTVAHELGHFLLHRGQNVKVLPRFANVAEHNDTEKEANCFAANLLVPKDMLLETMKKYGLSKEDEETLAILFGVSKEFMRYRLRRP